MDIEHVGYAVSDMKKAIADFTYLGFEAGGIISDERRGVDICLMNNGGYRIELVSPAAENSPVDGIIRKSGNTPYHICYSTSDIDAEIAALSAQRYKLMLPPEPAIAFGGRRVAFLYGSVGLIELLERES